MVPPLIERDVSPRGHPAIEVDPEHYSEAATIHAIKGRGLVATITPPFDVAVIVGLVTAWFSHKPDPVSDSIGQDAHRCNESLTQLRADFTQFKAEQSLHDLALESKMNELLARTWNGGGSQAIQPSQLAPGVSRALTQ